MLNRILTAAVLVVAIAASVQAAEIDVFILTGQSNSLGTVSFENPFDPGSNAADSQVELFWSNVSGGGFPPALYGDSAGAITTLQVQQGDNSAEQAFWGPEFGFGRTLLASGNSNALVVKVSRGGGGNTFWEKIAFESNPASGQMWGQLRDTVDLALGELTARGDTFTVRGLMYLQGESNNTTEASLSGTRLQGLANNLQTYINTGYPGAANGMYTMVGEIGASQSNAGRILTTTLQRALGESSSDVTFFGTGDQPLKSDGIHYGKDAKLEIGRRFADAYSSREFVENPNLLSGYSANEGSVNAIPHPIAQGWSLSGSTTLSSLEEVNDNGVPAWRVLDNNRSGSPGYKQSLNSPDFQAMFDKGWVFKVEAKVISGGGQALWSLTQGNDPGWNMGDPSNMNGFQLERLAGTDVSSTADDELEVTLWQNQGGSTVNLGAGSANEFHTLELRGAAGSNFFDFYVDDVLEIQGIGLRDGTGNSSLEDLVSFGSDSLGGFGREVYWNEVSITALPSPSTSVLLGVGLIGFMGLWRPRRFFQFYSCYVEGYSTTTG